MVKNRESRASLPDSEMADESNAPATTNTTTDGSEHEANDDGDVSMDVCALLPQILLLSAFEASMLCIYAISIAYKRDYNFRTRITYAATLAEMGWW